jgi:hypothetical protein
MYEMRLVLLKEMHNMKCLFENVSFLKYVSVTRDDVMRFENTFKAGLNEYLQRMQFEIFKG